MKKFLIIVFSGFLPGVLIYFYLNYSEGPASDLAQSYKYMLAGLCGVLIAYIVYITTRWLDAIIPWQKRSGLRLLSGIILHSIFSFLVICVLFYGYSLFIDQTDNFLNTYQAVLIKLAILIFTLSLVYSIIYFALYSYNMFARVRIEQIETERRQIDLQLKALKSQLSPHFLFNSFNTISALIFDDVVRAEAFIRKLAHTYQYALRNYEKKWISVNEELLLLQSYRYLLETRFEKHLFFDLSLNESHLDSKIPPLTLQILVENAIKHNKMSAHEPLRIRIWSTEKNICISNNKTEAPSGIKSTNLGLKNIEGRYKILAGSGIQIVDKDTFTVKLPIIP